MHDAKRRESGSTDPRPSAGLGVTLLYVRRGDAHAHSRYGSTLCFHKRGLFLRQLDDELGSFVLFRFDADRALVFLYDDVVADGETQAGAFAGRLGGEEGKKDLLANR